MGSSQSKEAPTPPPSTQPNISQQLPKKEEDWSAPLANRALSKDLQSLVDKEEERVWDQIAEGHAPETTDTSLRYAAYANRFRTILLSAHRYVAYTSDIGESFRPVAHPWLVRGAYGVSWAYLIGDVSHEGYKAYLRQQQITHPELLTGELSKHATSAVEAVKQGDVQALTQRAKKGASEVGEKVEAIAQATGDAVTLPAGSGQVPAIEDWRAVMAQRAVFQSIASMGLPAFTIHSLVRYSGRAFKNAKAPIIRTWAPIGIGLAAVPFLPYMFDKPVEEAVEYTFHTAFRYFGGEEAVGSAHKIGREQALEDQNKARKLQEKEL